MLSTHHPRFKRTLLSSALILICSTGLSLAQSVPNTVELEEEELLTKKPTIDLSKIVVTAAGFAQEVKDAPASISVVSKQDLENAPFRDVTDAIADIPGVVITGGSASQDISIRGMASKYTLMMVDGKRINSRETRPNSDGSGIEQGWVPPLAAIERVEVIRGPMSSRYGSDAMGGVVNVITKKITDRWLGSVRSEYTVQHDSDAGNENSTEFYFSGPLVSDKLGLQLFGKYSGRNEDDAQGGYPKRNMENIGGKLTFVPIDGQTFELDYGVGFQKRESTAKSTSPRRAGESKYKRNNISARYLGEFDHGITTELLYSHEKNNNYTRKMITKNTEVSGNVIMPLGAHTVTIGGQYREEELQDNNNRLNPDISSVSRKTHALFIEDEWWLLDNFSLTGGVRYDHDDVYGSNFAPRLYAVWNIDEAFTLKGGISTGYKTPGLRQAVADWGHGTGGGRTDGVILGNPNLKPEKTTNYEIGINYSPDATLDLNATAFYTKFKDKLQNIEVCRSPAFAGPEYDPAVDNQCDGPNGTKFYFVQTNENIDTAELKGLELAARWKPTDTITLQGSYTYTKTKQTSGDHKGAPLNRIPEHNFNVKADWQATHQANIWTKVTYRGKEQSLSRQGALGTEYDAYTLVDIGATYKFNRDVSVYGGVYNLTDKQIDNDTYGKKLDGRRYWIGVNVDF